MIRTISNLNDVLPQFVPPKEAKPIDVAVAFFRYHLKDGSRPVSEIKRLAARHHIKPTTLTRARQMMGCRTWLDGVNWMVAIGRPINEEVSI